MGDGGKMARFLPVIMSKNLRVPLTRFHPSGANIVPRQLNEADVGELMCHIWNSGWYLRRRFCIDKMSLTYKDA